MNSVKRLHEIFYPRAVAVIGASVNPEKVGYRCLTNLLDIGFRGRVYPVNPGLDEAFGLKAYPSVSAIPGEVDLAVIVIPAELVPPAVEDCVTKGVKGAILITSGFKELDTEIGLDLQERIKDIADRDGLKIIGPNTLGLVNPHINLNATFTPASGLTKAGSVAVAAQSGGMCNYIIRALTVHNVGVSKAMGLGNRCNLDFDEVLAYFAEDEETKVIVIYVEGLEQPERLMNMARQVVKRKPILALKGGRSEQSSRATISHTGALAGKYELYRAAFTQTGIIVVDDTAELIDNAKALVLQPPSSGNRVAILANMAGPGIVMADRCQKLGLKLAEFSPATWRRLRELISPLNAVDNPVDLAWASGNYDTSREVIKAVMEDDGVDAITVNLGLTPEMTFPRAAIDLAKHNKKPITMCLGYRSGPNDVRQEILEEEGIPTYPLPERAVTALSGLVRYGAILKASGS